jgi:predicted transposase/invertase (TIGR01784 family)
MVSWKGDKMKFADPMNNVTFKKIFNDEKRKEVLISFLNNMLGFVGTQKEIIKIIKNPCQVPRLKWLKETVMGIAVLDKRNINYFIDVQLFHTDALEKRIMYYVSKAYYQQLEKSDNYPKLNQVIFLGFLDFVFFKENPDYATRHLILDEITNGHHFKDFELNFIELPKFKKSLDELENIKDKWIYFVKNAGDMTIIPGEMEEPKEIRQAFEVANQLSWTKDELDIYDFVGMKIQDERGRVQYAMRVGKEEGIAEGREEGREEKALEIAGELLRQGISIDVIIKATGLTGQEIQAIRPSSPI